MSFDISTAREFIGIPELAARWGVTEAHIYNLVNRKVLPAHRVGRRLIVRQDEAQSFIERNATTTSQLAKAA